MEPEEKEAYVQYRNQLETSLASAYEHFDKGILTLSGGALFLSIAFIEKIVKLADASALWLLGIAWMGFAFSILSTLTSVLLSQYAFRKQIEYADRAWHGEKEYFTKPNQYAEWVACLNKASAVLFAIGVLSIVTFAWCNLKGETVNMSKNQGEWGQIQKGMVPSPMPVGMGGHQTTQAPDPPGQYGAVPAPMRPAPTAAPITIPTSGSGSQGGGSQGSDQSGGNQGGGSSGSSSE